MTIVVMYASTGLSPIGSLSPVSHTGDCIPIRVDFVMAPIQK